MQIPALTEAFNNQFYTSKSVGQIKSALSNHKILCGRTGGNKKGTLLAYTQEQADYIKQNYPLFPLSALTVMFNSKFGTARAVRHLKAFTNNHKIRAGRSGCFEKGHLPWNTGTKGLTGANSGSFNSGHTGMRTKPIGHERICSKNGFILIKIEEKNPHTGCFTRYKAKHRVVWEAEHGPVPPKHVVSFKDGDVLNCSPNNLMLLSMAENLYLNRHGYSDLPDELRPSMLGLAKLETKRFSLDKPAGDKDHDES